MPCPQLFSYHDKNGVVHALGSLPSPVPPLVQGEARTQGSSWYGADWLQLREHSENINHSSSKAAEGGADSLTLTPTTLEGKAIGQSWRMVMVAQDQLCLGHK